jgi:type I restriction enzyme S subunit
MVDEMKVKEGYKMTEVGVIPEDWEINSFKDVSWVNQGLQIAIEKRLKRPTQKSKKYITIQFLNNSKEVEYIDNYVDSVCCNKDDVLMTRTGNTGIVVTGVEGVFHNNFFKINFDRKRINKDYLVYYLNQSKLKEIILIKAGTSTIPDLNHNDFYSIPIVLPKLSEQKAIAKALSDIDNLITSLEKLIDKKKKIKQGTMQQLLTGKKRLPGFTGEWVLSGFKDIFIKLPIKKYQINTTDYLESGNYPVIDQGKKKIVAYTNKDDKLFKCPNEGVIIFGDHTRELKYINFDFVVGADGTQILTTKNNHSALFYYYCLLNKEIPNTGYNRHFKFLLEMEFMTPKLEEQQAIANILYDMDSEIEALEKKLIKHKTIKQGMMQELLTGRIRLI